MIKFLTNSLLLLVFIPFVIAQKAPVENFIPPLNIPLFLSGNFGELRATHFHAGIDLKTQSVVGKPVLTTQEGYVSRIKISDGGYGNALYLTHPSGYTSVYGHLENFIPEIDEYVKSNQYLKESFEIELFPSSKQFVFSAGDIIAYSGNSGRSGGPHLHFEIRKTNGQVPQNGLLFNFPIADNKPPVFRNLFLYSFKEAVSIGNNGEIREQFAATRVNDTLYSLNKRLVTEGDFFGFGAEIYDYLNGSSNRCGVYKMNLFVNDEIVFGFTIDEVSFSHTRYINAHMDYELKAEKGKSVHRLFSYPHNRLPIYYSDASKGYLTADSGSVSNIKIVAYDAYGNKSVLAFEVEKQLSSDKNLTNSKEMIVNWEKGFQRNLSDYSFSIPPNALYRSVFLDTDVYIDSTSVLADTIYLHNAIEPLQRSFTLKTGLSRLEDTLKQKVLFASISNEGELEPEGGDFEGGKLILRSRSLGKYVLVIDTVAPVIQSIRFTQGGTYSAGSKLIFKVWDELSGLKNYAAYIDNEWVLLEYDAKSDKMTYIIDEARLEKNKTHGLKIVAVDNKFNSVEFYGEFKY